MSVKPGVYVPWGQDGCELCHPVDDDDFERISLLVDGGSRQEFWVPIQVQVLQDETAEKRFTSDALWLGSHALIFRGSVIESMGDVLLRGGEVLPLSCPTADLHIYNPTSIIDALDESRSSVTRFTSGRIMMINKYAFLPDRVSGVDIFKIPSLRVSPTFLSHRFVERWKECGLKGLGFRLVWPVEGR